MNTPIIRFEVEGIRQSVTVALTQHQAQMDADILAYFYHLLKKS